MASNIPLCGPCERDDEHHQSISWCSTCGEGLCQHCSKEHRKNRASSKHTVLWVESMSTLSEFMISQWNRCETHTKKEKSLYCRNHDQVCCTLCIPGFHSRCDDVMCIEEASKHCRQGFALTDLQTRIENMIGIYDAILKKKNDNIIALGNDTVHIENDIPGGNAAESLQKKTNIRQDFSAKRDMVTQKIKEESDEITKKKAQLHSFYTDIHTLIKLDADLQLFVAVKMFDIALHKLEQEMQRGHFTKMYSISQTPRSFDSSSMLSTLQIIEKDLVDIPELSKLIQCQDFSIGSGNLKLTKTVDLNQLLETESAKVWKVCCFPLIKKVALSDTDNNCIYVYDCERGEVKTMNLGRDGISDFSPCYVTLFDKHHALVASMYNKLLKINILDLTIKEDIKTCSGSQFPMCCVGDYLLVCTYEEDYHTIIVSKLGRIVRKIPVYTQVGYMCSYGDDKFIYTSFYGQIIECITLEGNSIFKVTLSDLNNHFKNECSYGPMGVCVDKYNFIYVVLINKNILRLTPEGKIDKFVLDLEYLESGMAYTSTTHELVLIHRLDIIKFYKIE